MDRPSRGAVRAALALCLAMALSGCASYVANLRQMDRALAAHDPDAALAALAPLKGGHSEALYLLDKAMLLRMQGDYAGSIKAFEGAKPLLRYLEATSVSETAAALMLSENLRSYTPPLYERLLLHVYQGLNYLQSGDAEAARVEVEQIDVLLKRLYPGTDAAPHGGDAFARYFAGLVYEDAGDWSDAMIAYRKAYQAYRAAGLPVPPGLQASLCRFADYLGLDKELKAYKQQFDVDHWLPVAPHGQAADGQLVFILGDGLAPRKVAVTQWVQSPKSGHLFSISLPALRADPPRISGATISVGGETATTARVESVAQNADKALATQLPQLTADEIARNVTRAVVANKADDKRQGLGALVSLIGTVVDRADTRIWNTLPDNIQMARVALAPGTYHVTVALTDGGAVVGTKTFDNVLIKPGRITFATWHAISY